MRKMKGYPMPLGITEQNDIVNFSIAVESGKTCNLCIYKKGEETPELVMELQEEDAVGEIRFAALPRSKVKGKEYHYEIDGENVLDPCVKAIVNTPTGKRGKVLANFYDWEGDKPLEIPPHHVIAYSLHVRGFSKHRTSKTKKKGTFRALIEKIPYLQELGINQIQCMPIYAFEDTQIYKNYWGYGPAFCFAIKQEYAAGKDAETELKDMVKAFHQNGIEVVLNLPFTNETPKQLIVDCLRYYVMEYHIDGFLLNSSVAPMECIHSDAMLRKTKILQNNNTFQDTMRRFLRGDEGMLSDVMRELKQTVKESGSCNYITNHTGFTLTDLVSYNKKHNEANGEGNFDGPNENYSWNCGREGNTHKEEILRLRKRQRKNAMALLLLAQGTPCILAGDEFGNSQKGNNNVYCQDNETAWLNWKDFEKEQDFFEYVKQLISIRREYSVFGSEQLLTGTDRTGCGVPDISYHGESAWQMSEEEDYNQLGIYYHHADGTDCFVAYNMDSEEHSFALPQLSKEKSWYQVFSTADDIVRKNVVCEENQREISVEARTVLLLVGR